MIASVLRGRHKLGGGLIEKRKRERERGREKAWLFHIISYSLILTYLCVLCFHTAHSPAPRPVRRLPAVRRRASSPWSPSVTLRRVTRRWTHRIASRSIRPVPSRWFTTLNTLARARRRYVSMAVQSCPSFPMATATWWRAEQARCRRVVRTLPCRWLPWVRRLGSVTVPCLCTPGLLTMRQESLFTPGKNHRHYEAR